MVAPTHRVDMGGTVVREKAPKCCSVLIRFAVSALIAAAALVGIVLALTTSSAASAPPLWSPPPLVSPPPPAPAPPGTILVQQTVISSSYTASESIQDYDASATSAIARAVANAAPRLPIHDQLALS